MRRRNVEKFKPTVESLKNYKCPQWFQDAKFGIYLHWGVYSVAERGEWYARQMYIEGHDNYKYHVKTYGHPSEFGYKDFIPMWNAQNFDPDRLVALFKKAGAKYFTPCAVHHDNFDLWNSKHHKWNSVNMGPKKDITGMWREATLKHGLRFGVTTHLARTYSWFNVNKGSDASGPYEGVPYDGNNSAYRDFYLEPSEDTNRKQPLDPPESWRQEWALRIKDLIDNYHPDHLYFDGAIPFQGDDQGKTGMDVIAHYYNDSLRRHDGNLDAVMCIKRISDHGMFVEGVTTVDFERSKADEVMSAPWQTDDSIGPWGYRAGAKYASVTEIIHKLVDIVSKNGNLLLNVPPKADGTLDSETEAILEGIGEWFDINGEAIYSTRPWKRFGEDQVRFTTKDTDTLYAIFFNWPEDELLIQSLGTNAGLLDKQIKSVSLIGSESPIRWEQTEEYLKLKLPEQEPCEHAFCLKIQL